MNYMERATVEYNKDKEMPSVDILVSRGENNISIKISDRGGGASLEQQQK